MKLLYKLGHNWSGAGNEMAEYSMRKIRWVLIIAMLNLTCISSNVWSAQNLLTTIKKESTQHDSNKHKLKMMFIREEMQKQLQHYGLTNEEAQNRIDALTDEEVAKAVSVLEDLPAGGFAPIIFIPLVIAINLVILVIAILWRSVDFPFMEKNYSE